MDENQKPKETEQPVEPAIQAQPTGVVVSEHKPVGVRFHMSQKSWLFSGAGLVVVMIALGVGYQMHSQSTKLVTTAANTNATSAKSTNHTDKTAESPAPTAQTTSPKTTTPTKTTTTVTATPAPAPAPTPWVNTTNCIPQTAPKYGYDANKTNSQYLQTNGYSETTKLYAALQFAGLIDTVNTKQYVVFAPNDWVFDNKLTAAQLAWMYQSPANMRAVLGWQIATSCITWDGVNPVKNLAKGTPVTVNTLNGSVTYTHGSPGNLGNAGIAIWDWFTSNGSVTFVTDFVNKSAIP